jgi:hypothetical protein
VGQYRGVVPWKSLPPAADDPQVLLDFHELEMFGEKAFQRGASPPNSKAQVDHEIRLYGTQIASGRPRPAAPTLGK